MAVKTAKLTEKGCAGAYRFGFNGKEKDTKGEWGSLTHYDYGFRIYNPSIGKFLSVDPLTKKYPELTPYQFASNTPIAAVDLDGLETLYFGYRGVESQIDEINAGMVQTQFVVDATATYTVVQLPMKVKASATVGKSTVFSLLGKSGHFTHYGVTLGASLGGKDGVPINIGETYSIGVVNGLEGDMSNYGGFFIGIGGVINGIGVNHSGWLRLGVGENDEVSSDGYTGSTSISLNPVEAIAALGGVESAGVSINFDFYADDSSADNALTQFNKQVKQSAATWDVILKGYPSEVQNMFKQNYNKIITIIRENIESDIPSGCVPHPVGGSQQDEYLRSFELGPNEEN